MLDNQLLMEPFLPLIKAQEFEKRYKWFYDHLKATANIDHNNIVPLQVGTIINKSCFFSVATKPGILEKTWNWRNLEKKKKTLNFEQKTL